MVGAIGFCEKIGQIFRVTFLLKQAILCKIPGELVGFKALLSSKSPLFQ
jgi:hypothetical protein